MSQDGEKFMTYTEGNLQETKITTASLNNPIHNVLLSVNYPTYKIYYNNIYIPLQYLEAFLDADWVIPAPGFVYGFCMVCVCFLYQAIQKPYSKLSKTLL